MAIDKRRIVATAGNAKSQAVLDKARKKVAAQTLTDRIAKSSAERAASTMKPKVADRSLGTYRKALALQKKYN